MPVANWKDEYSINVDEVDVQHQKIIELVTNLHASVNSCIDKDKLKTLLIDLVEYTRMHFSTEEKLMKKYDFPEFKAHHKDHKVLLKHLDRLVDAIASGKHPTFYSDYDVSSDWAITHISEHDTKLGEFLHSKDIF